MLVYDECLEARQRGVATAGSFVNTLVIFQVCLGSPRFLCCGSPGGERERDGNSCTSHWVRMCVQIKARRDLDPEICQQQFLSTAIGNFSSHMNPLCRTSAVPLKKSLPSPTPPRAPYSGRPPEPPPCCWRAACASAATAACSSGAHTTWMCGNNKCQYGLSLRC